MSTNPAAVDSYWMPFTANRDFKQQPRIIVGAEGHHYHTEDGRKLYDAFSGLWTSGLGHCHPRIVEAVQRQVATLDYSLGFQAASDKVFELAEKVTSMAPDGYSKVFFTNSGSESADTSLKIALGYHRARKEGHRTRLVGREKGYHGVNFGGMSVGGMTPNRKAFGASLLPCVDHLQHTWNLEHNAYSRGQPAWGAHFADDLERLAALHDGSNIAAVIVEPVSGSSGILPPPVGYLERLREICDKYGILLIFDEVITAFGRIGAGFAAERFGVMPDIINMAKGLTNGVIPMGAVMVRDEIFDTFMHGPEQAIELFHGYTYSGHPVAAAAGIAALDAYVEEGTFEQSRGLEQHFEDELHSFAGHPLVTDVRNFGLMGGLDLVPRPDAMGARGLEVHKKCFWEEDIVVRNGGDILQFSPFLNSRPEDITMTFEKVRKVLDHID
ncbi:MAG: aspartate aminotransferase family protein [Xanthomonadales bacterium]|nr:aspartate aminotransferase family protein [Gammaproteobacteria bacterium]MBT8055292.1 aspartate aminotransferase family protein [Gammaproteobacteria bacterium]NND57740.1 aspartate aminotransferase family protein [Xanthomonadales bacterium]NNK50679.1 aspartate aminotransferase family protein [Xanthomonadales bacterium]